MHTVFSEERLTARRTLSQQPSVQYFLGASKSGTGLEARAGRFSESKYCIVPLDVQAELR